MCKQMYFVSVTDNIHNPRQFNGNFLHKWLINECVRIVSTYQNAYCWQSIKLIIFSVITPQQTIQRLDSAGKIGMGVVRRNSWERSSSQDGTVSPTRTTPPSVYPHTLHHVPLRRNTRQKHKLLPVSSQHYGAGSSLLSNISVLRSVSKNKSFCWNSFCKINLLFPTLHILTLCVFRVRESGGLHWEELCCNVIICYICFV